MTTLIEATQKLDPAIVDTGQHSLQLIFRSRSEADEFKKALRAALAAKEPELDKRVWCGCGDQIMSDDGAECGNCVTARNATQRGWQGLTDEEIEDACWTEVDQRLRSFARAIEQALREKNT